MLPAPSQIERALGFRGDGLDDLVVVAEILDGVGDLDMHDAWLITDRLPTVDCACRLVHVVTGTYPLASPEDLTGASLVERVYLAGMSMHRNGAAWLEPQGRGCGEFATVDGMVAPLMKDA